MRFRVAPIVLCLLLVISGICTNLCATPPPADSQHPCCPHHQSDKSCGHAATGQDSQAVVKQVSHDAPLAVLPRPLLFPAPMAALFTPARSAVAADTSPQQHFILRL